MDDAHFPAADGRLRQVAWEGRDDVRYLVEKPTDISSPYLSKAKSCLVGELQCSPSDLDITYNEVPTTFEDMLRLTYRMRLVKCDDNASIPLWTSALNALDNMSKMAPVVGNIPPSSLVQEKKLHLSHSLFEVSFPYENHDMKLTA